MVATRYRLGEEEIDVVNVLNATTTLATITHLHTHLLLVNESTEVVDISFGRAGLTFGDGIPLAPQEKYQLGMENQFTGIIYGICSVGPAEVRVIKNAYGYVGGPGSVSLLPSTSLIGAVNIQDATTTDRAKVRPGNTAANIDDIIQPVQHQDVAGGVQPAGDIMARGIFTRLTNGTLEALLKAANAAAAVGSTVLGAQLIGPDGNRTPSGADSAGGIFTRITNGVLDALLKRADTATAIDSTVLAIQHVGEDGEILPSGRATDPISVTDDLVFDSVDQVLSAIASAYSGAQIYFSNVDFDAAQSSVTEIALTNMVFGDPSVEDFIGVIVTDATGGKTFYSPFDYEYTWTAGAVGEGTLAITGASFAATDEFTVFIRGAIRAYDATTETYDYTRNNPDWANSDTTVMLSETAGTDSVNEEYLDVGDTDAYTLDYVLDNGSGLVSMAIFYSTQDDGTVPASCVYTDEGLDEFGQATWTGADIEGKLKRDVGKLNIKYLKVVVTATGIGAANDGQWYIAVRKDQ